MSMPGDIDLGSGNSYWGANLTAFVDNGLIAESRVTDMAERIVAAWYLLGQDSDFPDGECHIRTLSRVCGLRARVLSAER